MSSEMQSTVEGLGGISGAQIKPFLKRVPFWTFHLSEPINSLWLKPILVERVFYFQQKRVLLGKESLATTLCHGIL